jgi:pimeloyl-ACP methyl ester carboxylesterase
MTLLRRCIDDFRGELDNAPSPRPRVRLAPTSTWRSCGVNPYATRLLFVLAVVSLLIGCTSPAAEFDDNAQRMGLERHVRTGSSFQHAVYRKAGAHTKTLHVYLGDDGTPWLGGAPAVDPTPRNTLVLRLMALDPVRAIYLGRPCYHGAAGLVPCSSHLWTTHRYSEEVVRSLSVVVRRLMSEQGATQVALFGYSGGGTLAVLLASRFPETVSVVTIAANLDTRAWAEYLWGGDLRGSLNPASGPALGRHVRQRHYAGAKDRVVPPDVAAPAARRLGGDLIVVDGYDHVCCWERLWPTILRDVAEKPA